jgi:hypothetical protein
MDARTSLTSALLGLPVWLSREISAIQLSERGLRISTTTLDVRDSCPCCFDRSRL